ncbi:unnamed protein product, partial [Pylaiella littoralis]
MVHAHEPSPAWPLHPAPVADGVDGHSDATRGSGGGSTRPAGTSVRDPHTSSKNKTTINNSDRNTHEYHYNKNANDGTFLHQSLALAPAWGGGGGERYGLVAAAAGPATAAATAAPREQ